MRNNHHSADEAHTDDIEPEIEPVNESVAELRAEIATARAQRAALGGDAREVLNTVLSKEELRLERELSERVREGERKLLEAEHLARLKAAEILRDADAELRALEIRDRVEAQRAMSDQMREDSPYSALAGLRRHSTWGDRVIVGILGAGMLWSAVNVQQNMAPGGMSDPLFWFSYLLEGMISGLMIYIALGTNKVRRFRVTPNKWLPRTEFALFALTLGLNTYPYVKVGHWYDAALHGVAPVMIGLALLAHHAMGGDFSEARKNGVADVRKAEAATAQPRTATEHPGITTEHLRTTAEFGEPLVTGRTEQPRTPTEHPALNTAHTEHRAAAATEQTEHPDSVTTAPLPRIPAAATAHRAPAAATEQAGLPGVHAGVLAAQRTAHPDRSGAENTEAPAEAPASAETTADHAVAAAAGEEVETDSLPDFMAKRLADEVFAEVSAVRRDRSAGGSPDAAQRLGDVGAATGAETAEGVHATESEGAPTVHSPAEASAAAEPETENGAASEPANVPDPGTDRAAAPSATEHPARSTTATAQPATAHRAAATATEHPGTGGEQSTAHADTAHRAAAPVTGGHTEAGGTDPAAAADPELWALAAEVHDRVRPRKFAVADIAHVLIRNRRFNEGPDRIYRDGGAHPASGKKWITEAADIEAERAAMGQVIALRK
ncbi:hypothetical protein [Nocardia sp. NPDC051750]|uniref:hypothetical protein n=1 Tax=Nocardia sp. NPDC051750 TaxID=3364325 RepID=UPI0037ADEA11